MSEQAEQPQAGLFAIERQLAQAILDYLQTRPYVEVAGLVQGLQQLVPLRVQPADAPAPERSASRGRKRAATAKE